MSKSGIEIDTGDLQAEQKRLAVLFVEMRNGCEDFDDAQECAQAVAEELGEITAKPLQAAFALDALSNDDP